jgi:hypothetical protein
MDKIVCYRAIAVRVLCVLVERVDGWCVYCGAVDGKDFKTEAQGVLERGDKLAPDLANAIFGGAIEDMEKRGLRFAK